MDTVPAFTDEQYVAALNAWHADTQIKRSDKVPLQTGGEVVEVHLGHLIHNLRQRGRRTAPNEVLTEALRRHGMHITQNSDGKWRIPHSGLQVRWSDCNYAAALQAWPIGEPIRRGSKMVLKLKGIDAAVPIGQLVKDLRQRGRRTAPNEVLTEALRRHGMHITQNSDEKWWIPKARQSRRLWPDERA